jgi:hypothetical protein
LVNNWLIGNILKRYFGSQDFTKTVLMKQLSFNWKICKILNEEIEKNVLVQHVLHLP